MRPLGIATVWLALVALVGTLTLGGSARAGLSLQDGTPAAATPEVAVTPPPASDVVTLVAWYAPDPAGEALSILPIAIDPSVAAAAEANAAAIGQAEFPEGGLPVITIGDTRFESYLRFEGDVPERWTWFNDEEGARPATLVLQVSGAEGTYANYFGTATFISRDQGGTGVLVLALRPPDAPAAESEAAPADEGAADEPAADDTAAEEGEAGEGA